MKKLVLSALTIALFSSAAMSQTPASAPSQGTSKKKVELKAKKPASIPAASTTATPSAPTPATTTTPAAPAVKVETPQASVPKVEAPKVETPQANMPKMESPRGSMPKAEIPAVNPMGDLGALGKNIATELGTKLLLNQIQGTKVGQLISTFLMAKSSFLPLLKSDPTGFASKLSGAQGDLMGGLKTVLSAQQMTNFMSMKPKTNDATNVLSSLFF